MTSKRRDILLCIGLFIATVAVFATAYQNEFVAYDDPDYITENPHVLTGLSTDNIHWAFATGHAANWHPLTWLSHQLDAQLYGTNPAGHHLTNVLFHAANAVLLYLIFRQVTGAVWRSLLIAAIFAFHPLRVESVAWAAERKDVLSTLFGLLSVLAYLRYVRRPAVAMYGLVLFLYALSLLSKPMLVTLPFLLLLLDFWPLKRTGFTRLIIEKLPLLALAIGSCIVTVLVQRAAGAVVHGAAYSLLHRFGNALLSVGRYALKLIYPAYLAVFYPDPPNLPIAAVVASGIFVVLVSAIAIAQYRSRPYILFGWLWFLGTLVPVIGIVQVGMQAMADRYTYVPTIGLIVALVWGLAEFACSLRLNRIVVATSAAATVAALIVITEFQLRYWHDTLSLFQHALNVTSDNFLAHQYVASRLAAEAQSELAAGRFIDASSSLASSDEHYVQSIRINPTFAESHYNYANSLLRQRRDAEAIDEYRAAIEHRPSLAAAHYMLGVAYSRQGQLERTIAEFSKALELDPSSELARKGLAQARALQMQLPTTHSTPVRDR